MQGKVRSVWETLIWQALWDVQEERSGKQLAIRAGSLGEEVSAGDRDVRHHRMSLRVGEIAPWRVCAGRRGETRNTDL